MFDAFLNGESNVFLLIGALIVGMMLIIFGGDKFVDSAIWIAVKTKMPKMLIGATLVSLGTTLPELFTSYTASASGGTAIAVGNAFGSIMCNTSLVLAITMTASPAKVGRKEFMPKYLILLGSVVLLLVFSIFGEVKLWQCIVLIVICVGYFAYNIATALRDNKRQSNMQSVECELSPEEASNKDDDEYAKYADKKAWLMILLFVLGAAGIAVGANLMVSSVSGLCTKLGVSQAVIALMVVAIGTSLPELVTALTSLKKNNTEISLGNVIGANILNATLITGGSGCISGGLKILPEEMLTTVVTVAFILAVLAIVGLPVIIKKRTYRAQGISCLVIYGGYIGFLIYQLVAGKA
ncbi:MAG: sodium:calcium antiporter [Corallococcus sp.]|nr:sodium:calcium antiporter [Corallococcus sp.]